MLRCRESPDPAVEPASYRSRLLDTEIPILDNAPDALLAGRISSISLGKSDAKKTISKPSPVRLIQRNPVHLLIRPNEILTQRNSDDDVLPPMQNVSFDAYRILMLGRIV